MCYLPYITVRVRIGFFLHVTHGQELSRDPDSPSRDPAMNPVTASETFHVGQFLADNVGIVATCSDMSPTFPTKGVIVLLLGNLQIYPGI